MSVKQGSGPHGQLLAQNEALLHPQDHSRGTAGVGESLWDQCNVEANPRGRSRAELPQLLLVPIAQAEGGPCPVVWLRWVCEVMEVTVLLPQEQILIPGIAAGIPPPAVPAGWAV